MYPGKPLFNILLISAILLTYNCTVMDMLESEEEDAINPAIFLAFLSAGRASNTERAPYSFSDNFDDGNLNGWVQESCAGTVSFPSGGVQFAGGTCRYKHVIPAEEEVLQFELGWRARVSGSGDWGILYLRNTNSDLADLGEFGQDTAGNEVTVLKPNSTAPRIGMPRLGNYAVPANTLHYWRLRVLNGTASLSVSTDGTNFTKEWESSTTMTDYIGEIHISSELGGGVTAFYDDLYINEL